MDSEVKKFAVNVEKTKKAVIDAFKSFGQYTGLTILAFGFAILFHEIINLSKIREIDYWPIEKSRGKILGNHFETSTRLQNFSLFIANSSIYSNSYRTRISFEYFVDNVRYVSYKCSFNEPWTTNPVEAETYKEKYKPGDIVDIIINPNNPEEAYLFNRHYHTYSYLVLSIVIISLALLIIRET